MIDQSPAPPCLVKILSGYTDKVSYMPGDEMLVFLQSNSKIKCGVSIYDGSGKFIARYDANLFMQKIKNSNPWENGFGYSVSAEIRLPETLTSGFYTIENSIPFIVKSSSSSDITIVYPINTINAYDDSGGKSLYPFNSTNSVAAQSVSVLRPIDSFSDQLDYCLPCLAWFPSFSDIKVNYIADMDLETYSNITQTKILIVIGHSEYWTRSSRQNFDNFVNTGGHAIIMSGNTMWWQARYSNNYENLVCYRDASSDPEPNPYLKTIEWADSTLHFPILESIGADFNLGGYGLLQDNGWDGYKIFNPESPLLEGLNFKKGDTLSLPTGEYDGAPTRGFDSDGFPLLDNSKLKFNRLELIGFDKGSREGNETIATFIVFQKTTASGIIINMASDCWCSSTGFGSAKSGNQIKAITRNAIYKLLNGLSVFSR